MPFLRWMCPSIACRWAANSSTVFGWGSSTVAKAYAKRMAQIQVDLEVLMGTINSTSLVAISGL